MRGDSCDSYLLDGLQVGSKVYFFMITGMTSPSALLSFISPEIRCEQIMNQIVKNTAEHKKKPKKTESPVKTPTVPH